MPPSDVLLHLGGTHCETRMNPHCSAMLVSVSARRLNQCFLLVTSHIDRAFHLWKSSNRWTQYGGL
jgi:hypothetical protein